MSRVWIVLLFVISKNPVYGQAVSNDNITVQVDERIALFSLAYGLALEDSLSVEERPCRTNYYRATVEKYRKYENHPLVEMIRSEEDKYAGADLPVVALALDENLIPRTDIDTATIRKQFGWYGSHLDSVSKMLTDFRQVTGYQSSPAVDLQLFKDSALSHQISQKLDSFFRVDRETKLCIYFDPLNNSTNKAITFLGNSASARGFMIGYFCDHPDSTEAEVTLRWNDDYRRIIFHENTHLYTSDLFTEYYDPTLDSLVHQEKFADEYTDIDEIIVRGITAKIIDLHYRTGDEEIAEQPPASGIVYDMLDKYLENPDMPFSEIYGAIIKRLRKEFL